MYLAYAINKHQQGRIPKEAPWKTLVLNKQFREKRGCEFSTATSGTERERGFVGNFLAGANLWSKCIPKKLII